MVAEKPSIADVLARSLSGGRSFKGDSRIPLHEYRGTFMGQDAAFSVTSVMGHVFRCALSIFASRACFANCLNILQH